MRYSEAKAKAIDIVDDFSKLDITANYGTRFNAKSTLDSVEVYSAIRAAMPHRTNKIFGDGVKKWKNVGSVDCVRCTTIAAFIKLVCRNAGIDIPDGEPT